MVKLRSYQQDLLRQVQKALDANAKARVMMQLPTGGGKTIIAGALLSDWLTGGRKAVWLTHRKELADQTCGMLTDAHISAVTNVNWTPGTDAPAMSQGAVILMAQTVGRRTAKREVWNRYNAEDLMVIDEAHHAAAEGWERAMRQWPGRILGMTATPWRLSKKEGFDHLFDTLRCGPQVADLQDDQWLCGAQTLLPPLEQRIRGGEVDLTGDYTESGIEQRETELSNEVELERLFESYLEDLPVDKRPISNLQKWRMFGNWEITLKSELSGWKNELTELKNRPIDKRLIFNSARNKVMYLLQCEAQAADLLPGDDGGSDEENEDGGNGPKRGRKGFENVQDYLIPVIQLMRNGKSHKEVFRTVAEKLKVNYNTVSAQCTRGLGISTQEFIEHVRSGRIIQIMKNKYSDKRELIDRELGDLYI